MQIVLPVAGAYIGAQIGGPKGAYIGWSVGAMIAGVYFAEEAPAIEGPRLSELNIQTSTYGVAIPKIYGTTRIAGNMIWSSGLIEARQEEEVGGKGTSGQTVVSYTYSASFAIGFCAGPIISIGRLWADGKLMFDYRNADFETLFASRKNTEGLRIYVGTEVQDPDSLMEAHEGAGNVPAYRGLAYIVFEDLQLADYGNRIPNITAEIGAAGSISSTEWKFTYDYPTGGTEWIRGIAITPEGNLMVCDVFEQNIITFDGISNSVLNAFDSDPIGSGAKYCIAIVGSNLISCTSAGTIYLHSGLTKKILGSFAGPAFHVSDIAGWGILLLVLRNHMGNDEEVYVYDTAPWITSGGSNDPRLLYKLDIGSLGLNMAGGAGGKGLAVSPNGDMMISEWAGVSHTYIFNGISTSIKETLTMDYNTSPIAIWEGNIVGGNLSNMIYVYEGLTGSIISFPIYDTGSGTAATLSNIVSSMCTDAGIATVNVASLASDTVLGYVRSRPMPIRRALEPLMQVYQFDAVEEEFGLTFVKRGGASIATITESELAAHDYGRVIPTPLMTNRMQELQLPQEVAVHYSRQESDYQPSTQRALRMVTQSKKKVNLEFPMVLEDDVAKRAAEILLTTAWIERTSYEFSVGINRVNLVPTSVIDVAGYPMLISELSLIAPGIVNIRAMAEQTSGYISFATGATIPFDDQVVALISTTCMVLLDLPALDDRASDAGFYVAAQGYKNYWNGAMLYISYDEGASFVALEPVLVASKIGTCTDTLSDGPVTVWDNKNTVNIKLFNSDNVSLSSSTKAAVLNGANAAVIGKDGAWEIIQFVTATLQGDGTYTLSTLLRGVRGTEWMAGAHVAGETFVLLDEGALERATMDSNYIGTEEIYREISIGHLLQNGANIAWTNNGVALECYSPVHIKGKRAVGGDLTITWIRRTRLAGEWRDGADAPLAEETEAYKVDIMDNGNIKRTIDAVIETCVYTAAQQTTDFGSAQASVHVKIYQVSAIVGKGYAGDATI